MLATEWTTLHVLLSWSITMADTGNRSVADKSRALSRYCKDNTKL
jgi:hypothetical protein